MLIRRYGRTLSQFITRSTKTMESAKGAASSPREFLASTRMGGVGSLNKQTRTRKAHTHMWRRSNWTKIPGDVY
ncbi:hypothetical protein C8J57DRAFT_1461632 [Mycena rebaudengoi]|nr:hypothetical protein C8J57DRAFT_1461632 [Mycena rebaudengoi]